MAEYWERFRGGATKPRRDRVHVTLSDKGVLLMNRKVFDMLGSPKAAVLLFNRSDCRIGISPAHPQLADAFPVKEKTNYWIINAAPFCRHFGISMDKTEAFVEPDLGKDGILRLNLSNTVSVSGRRRRRP